MGLIIPNDDNLSDELPTPQIPSYFNLNLTSHSPFPRECPFLLCHEVYGRIHMRMRSRFVPHNVQESRNESSSVQKKHSSDGFHGLTGASFNGATETHTGANKSKEWIASWNERINPLLWRRELHGNAKRKIRLGIVSRILEKKDQLFMRIGL